ncbi:MAG: hypothetical protein AB8C95_01280 [Phycisphaeraceae bacterium]
MADIDLSQSFPEATPVNSAPPLSRINGFGFGLYGSRDNDREQGLHVKTLCLCALFIPVFSLRSYVVANADNGGWYFLAKVPLSGFAKLMNIALVAAVLCIAGGIAITGYTGSAAYKAGQQLAEAQDAQAAGDLGQAAQLYKVVTRSGTEHAAQARLDLADLAEESLQQGSAADLSQVMPVVVDYEQYQGSLGQADWVPLTLNAVARLKSEPPRELISLLDTIEPLVTETLRERWDSARFAPLKRLVKAEPTNVDALSELAVVYESRNEPDEAKTLLEPVFYRLAESEGARVLGQIMLREGDVEKACTLLEPYTSARIAELQTAEQAWDTAYESAYDVAVAELENGKAPSDWYDRYDIAAEQDQDTIFWEYVTPRINENPSFIAARERYAEVSGVVDVALDLGVAQLERAQGYTDPELRRTGLEEAEQTFLSVQGSASDNATYRLYLGQVYFWLGRATDGNALFDAYLAEYPGNANVMASVARLLRQVGEKDKARNLYSTAYEASDDQAIKYDLAEALAAMSQEREDMVKWLNRCAPDNTSSQAALKNILGKEAAEAGQDDKAVALFDDAIALYSSLPETSSSLNNGALVWLQRFYTTGDVADRNKALDQLVRAVELEPSGTVLLQNTANTLLSAALYDVLATRLDMRTLELNGSISSLSYTYENQTQWQVMAEEIKAKPRFVKAVAMYDRVVLLAPKNPGAYEVLGGIYDFTEDESAQQALLDRAKAAAPDISGSIQSIKLYRQGHYDEINQTRSENTETKLRATLARTDLSPATRSAASVMLANILVGRHPRGEPVESDEALALAESAYQLKPSSATRSALNSTLCFRILEKLSAKDSAAKATWQKLHRSHSNRQIIAILLDQQPQTRAMIAQDPDMKRFLAVRAEQREQFPRNGSVSAWAITRYIAPDQAAIEAQLVKAHTSDRLTRELFNELMPYSADSAWSTAWGYEIDGNPTAAQQKIMRYQSFDLD